MIKMNPFIYGRPIVDPSKFFGRRGEVRRLLECLHNGYEMVVIGENRIGKTSLLNYVATSTVHKEHDLLHVRIELQLINEHTSAEQLWLHILQELAKSTPSSEIQHMIKQFSKEDLSDGFAVYDVFQQIRKSHQKIALLISEFDKL